MINYEGTISDKYTLIHAVDSAMSFYNSGYVTVLQFDCYLCREMAVKYGVSMMDVLNSEFDRFSHSYKILMAEFIKTNPRFEDIYKVFPKEDA